MFKATITAAALAATATSAAAIAKDYEAKVVGYAYGVAYMCELEIEPLVDVNRSYHDTPYQGSLDDYGWGLHKAATELAIDQVFERGCAQSVIVDDALLDEVGR
jgi:hypothetical protein